MVTYPLCWQYMHKTNRILSIEQISIYGKYLEAYVLNRNMLAIVLIYTDLPWKSGRFTQVYCTTSLRQIRTSIIFITILGSDKKLNTAEARAKGAGSVRILHWLNKTEFAALLCKFSLFLKDLTRL